MSCSRSSQQGSRGGMARLRGLARRQGQALRRALARRRPHEAAGTWSALRWTPINDAALRRCCAEDLRARACKQTSLTDQAQLLHCTAQRTPAARGSDACQGLAAPEAQHSSVAVRVCD